MNLSTQSVVVIGITALLYLAALGLFGRKLGPIRTGVVLLVISLIPLAWQHWFTDGRSPSFGILLFGMFLLPGAMIFWGASSALSRKVRGRSED